MATKRIRREDDGTLVISGPSARTVARWVAHVSSAYTTCLFVQALLGDGVVTLLMGLLLELLLYAGKKGLKRNKGEPWGLGCMLMDTVLNGGGLWPTMLKLDASSTWQMFAVSLGLGGEVRSLPALIISLVLGFLLAIAPFALEEKK